MRNEDFLREVDNQLRRDMDELRAQRIRGITKIGCFLVGGFALAGAAFLVALTVIVVKVAS